MTREIEHRIETYDDGLKAMVRIDKAAAKNIYDWLIVGKAMVEAQNETFENIGTNRSDTLAYRKEFGAVLRRQKLHDEDPHGPDKTTRGFLLKIMEREIEVLAWHKELPKDKRREWNHPCSVWRHFESAHKQAKDKPQAKASPITGLSAAEEAQQVENAQIEGLHVRDQKIETLRDTVRDHNQTIAGLNATIVQLRKAIGLLLKKLGFEVSELPTDEQIVEATRESVS